MDTTQLLHEVQGLFRDVLDNDEIRLNPSTRAKDIEEWDSLTNIQLVVALEKKFGVKFTTAEILSWANIGDLLNSLAAKKSK